MRAPILLLCAAIAASAAAQQPEINYPAGSLGYNAILNADYDTAERQIRSSGLSKYDPARALNLGYVLAKKGRADLAERHFLRVLAAEEAELILADGRTISSHEAADKALAALGSRR